MTDSLAGVALGAGSGARLRPLTLERPKVLCPVAGEALIDHAIGRLVSVTCDVAVNVHEPQHESRTHLAAHLHDVHVSVERGEQLGTAGALGALRPWIDGRAVVVVNGDTWCPGPLTPLVDGWDGASIRILVAGSSTFGPGAAVAGALLPWSEVRDLDAVPSGLWEVSWRRALEQGRIGVVTHDGPFVDCADPADYLRANLLAVGGSWVAPDASVAGTVDESVVWPGAVVRGGEHLRRAIRTTAGRTVLVRR
jgi:MurNAc alpha-1-phosphate uridylyltransferase